MRARGWVLASAIAFASLGAKHAEASNLPVASPEELVRIAADAAPAVDFGRWQGTGYGGFIVPENLDIADDGGVDVIVHFNAAMMADTALRSSKTNAVIISIAIAPKNGELIGSSAYSKRLSDPGYLERAIDATLAMVGKEQKRPLQLRRLGLCAWSAGMGGVGRLLRTPRWAERIDSIVLLDALHAGYLDKNGRPLVKDPVRIKAALGEEAVDLRSLEPLAQFARLAMQGKKTLVVTASAIVPPNYASASEAAQALFRLATHKPVTPLASEIETAMVNGTRPMTLRYRGDHGNFHVFGWNGRGKRDHFDQLHLVGDLLREHVGHRWRELAHRERAAQRS